MFSSNIRIDGLESDSKYVFQYVKNVELRNAKITTKDAFWEVENVTIYDSELNGEYLGWHSRNLRLVNCHITGEQPLCYAHDLVLENCTFGPDCDRAFEYSSVQATIKGAIGGVKNPRTGCITAESYGEIILDENIKAPADCELRLWEEKDRLLVVAYPRREEYDAEAAATTGFSVQVAHRIGAEDFAGARKILRQSVTATLIFSSLLAVTGITISDMLPSWLVGDADYGCHGSFNILDIELCFRGTIFLVRL